MKRRIVKKNLSTGLTTIDYFCIATALLIISIFFFKIYTNFNFIKLFLVLSIILISTSIIIYSFAIKKSWNSNLNSKNNPLTIFKNKQFDDWLIKSNIFKKIDENNVEIPVVEISKNKNYYYLDIQEFYERGEFLLNHSNAINAYAHQNGCHMHVVESFRHNGFIRYVFIKQI
ncbi:hypothetical protein G15_0101 [Enterococcus avium]|nr:hypothetical protein G15_0101 [Enterococcus avium]